MFRRNFARRPQGQPQRGFRWRGGDLTRLEQFSDAAFAFAITLLVVSLEVPKTLTQLVAAMRGFLAFGLCFAMLIWLWYEHYLFFRRYGLRDARTVVLNSAIIFVVLFYIYPLKFLSTLLVNVWIVGDIRVPAPDGTLINPLTPEQAPLMMFIYNAGFFAVMGLYWRLYERAMRLREKLQFTPFEINETKFHARGFLLCMMIAVVSTALVQFGGPQGPMWGGFFYFAIGPTMFINGMLSRKKRMELEAQQPREQQGGQRDQRQQGPSREQRQQSGQREQRPQGQQGGQRDQRQQGSRQQFNPRREQRGPRPPQQPRRDNPEPPKPETT